MSPTQPLALQKWHAVIKDRNHQLLDELLADDVVFHSPVVWKPQSGKTLTKLYLMAAEQVLGGEGFTYVREVIGEKHFVLEFTKEVEGIVINGVDMIEINDEGQIIDFKVMVRPLKGMQKIHQKMAEMLMKHK
jgi:hypothetical protein